MSPVSGRTYAKSMCVVVPPQAMPRVSSSGPSVADGASGWDMIACARCACGSTPPGDTTRAVASMTRTDSAEENPSRDDGDPFSFDAHVPASDSPGRDHSDSRITRSSTERALAHGRPGASIVVAISRHRPPLTRRDPDAVIRSRSSPSRRVRDAPHPHRIIVSVLREQRGVTMDFTGISQIVVATVTSVGLRVVGAIII
jgi:hypothetical protein